MLVPINFRLSVEEVKYIVEHSGARVLYVDPELEDAMKWVECEHKFVIGSDEDMYLEGKDPEPWEPEENATATINYTSGTTARPKGVQITHRNIWVNARHLRAACRGHRPRRLPAHAADVPRQRLGDDVRDDRAAGSSRSRSARSTAPRSCAGSRSTA